MIGRLEPRLIEREFGGLERFKKEFTQAVMGVKGSGWAVLQLLPEYASKVS